MTYDDEGQAWGLKMVWKFMTWYMDDRIPHGSDEPVVVFIMITRLPKQLHARLDQKLL